MGGIWIGLSIETILKSGKKYKILDIIPKKYKQESLQ